MPNCSRNHEEDANQAAFRVARKATSEDAPAEKPTEKNAAAVELGRLGGLRGGKARAKKLTPERRREIAKNAARSRWHGKDPD